MNYPPIPADGLAEVLGSWVGRGEIWDALAIPPAIRDERHWSPRDVLRRARRIVFEQVRPDLELWPKNLRSWVDALPAARAHERTVQPAPFTGVSWVDTFRSGPWPPEAFVGRESERGADTLVVTALRWTAEALLEVCRDAALASDREEVALVAQIKTVSELLSIEPVASARAVSPRRVDLTALRREGRPWGAVANVAEALLLLTGSPLELAWQLLLPDPEIRWRLFHLSILGVILCACRKSGYTISSLRPLGGSSTGPNYRITERDGVSWELWFEASRVLHYEGETSPYVEATAGVAGAGNPLGADLLLVRPGSRALVIECKYSDNPQVVARNGYMQAVTYAAEIGSRLGCKVASLVVGPASVVQTPSFTELQVGRVGVVPPSYLATSLQTFFDEDL